MSLLARLPLGNRSRQKMPSWTVRAFGGGPPSGRALTQFGHKRSVANLLSGHRIIRFVDAPQSRLC